MDSRYSMWLSFSAGSHEYSTSCKREWEPQASAIMLFFSATSASQRLAALAALAWVVRHVWCVLKAVSYSAFVYATSTAWRGKSWNILVISAWRVYCCDVVPQQMDGFRSLLRMPSNVLVSEAIEPENIWSARDSRMLFESLTPEDDAILSFSTSATRAACCSAARSACAPASASTFIIADI
jgi:hypothetical protein